MANTELDGPDANPADDPLWARIEAYAFDALDPGEPFAARLAREHLWSTAYAERVIEEYRRFCYLAVRAGHPVVPSDAVDQVWHLHLGYSREYWQEFCARVLGFDLHHAPTRANAVDEDRQSYNATLAAYERLSGERPPEDIWPAANPRFGGDGKMRRVSTADYLIIRRPPKSVLWAAQLGLILGALYSLWHGAYMTGVLVGIAAGAVAIYRDWTDNPWKKPSWRDHEEGWLRTDDRGDQD